MIKRKAFTLAEVVITIGVIGVIAALTIPGLISNFRKEQYESQLKKTYAVLTESIKRSMLDNGKVSTWGLDKTDKNLKTIFDTYYKPYLLLTANGVGTDGGSITLNSGVGISLSKKDNCIEYVVYPGGAPTTSTVTTYGSNAFTFKTCPGEDLPVVPSCSENRTIKNDRSELISGCKDNGKDCSCLFVKDGLNIKKDYPRAFSK